MNVPEHITGMSREALFRHFASSPAGLTGTEAGRRQRRYGHNQIVFHRAKPPWRMLLEGFTSLFPLLLLAAALLSFFANMVSPGQGYELIAFALLGVVVLNALVTFFQNHKVEKLMISFLDYIPEHVGLLRDGRKVLLEAKDVVPGDILFVQEGDKLCADGVVIESGQLLVDESILSGESEPVAKAAIAADADDECMVRSGATVMKGSANVLVTKTGRSTSLGAVSELSQTVKRDLTPMQKELQNFVRKITWLALGIGGVFFLIGFAIGNPFWTNLIFAIGIIVANVPEGLLPTVTLALTQASARMAAHNAVIKHMLSVETLGSTTVICTDKTGTLTQNRLHVESLYLDFTEIPCGDRALYARTCGSRTLTEIMCLCNDVIATRNEYGQTVFKGDPTETAMAEFADPIAGYDALRGRFELLENRPFDAGEKYMSATYRTPGGTFYMTVKGAPEVILPRCSLIHTEGFVRDLEAHDRERLMDQAAGYAGNGLRVLSLAYRVVKGAVEGAEAEQLVFVGHVAMVDPPRPEVPAAVAACKTAGIRIIVVSGDKAETVVYIARELGITQTPRIVEGEELAGMDQAALVKVLASEEVIFARVAPEQKLAIVEALKTMGEVVAVTGDGVNDAPALKRADIGVSMGLRGTDVAKEASDVILLDDNFATIIKAIEEGRAVYDNIKKFITYILTSNVPEILPFIAYVLLPLPLPITVVQILSIDLITDILPAIGLGNEPPEADIMRRPPRRRQERLVSIRTFLRSYGIIGPAETALSFAAFFAVLHHGGWHWGEPLATNAPLYGQATGAFLATIIFSQIGNVMACRTNRQSAWRHLFRRNPWILGGIAVEIAFILSILYVPAFHHFFSTYPLPGAIWAVILLAPPVIFVVEEIRKYLVRKGIRILSA